MTKDEIASRTRTIISEWLDRPIEQLTDEAKFSDLEADSLDQIEIVMALEEEFNIEVTDEEAGNIRTVGEAVKAVEAKVNITPE